jgi:ubiquitin carboxyl-terminal hydrolase 2
VQKQTEIWTLPQVLIIHIKRFYFDERRMDYRKINEAIRFEKSIAI